MAELPHGQSSEAPSTLERRASPTFDVRGDNSRKRLKEDIPPDKAADAQTPTLILGRRLADDLEQELLCGCCSALLYRWSSSTHASIISVAGDVNHSGYIVQRANLLTLSNSCCLLWVRVSFVCPKSPLCFSRRHCDRHAQGHLSLVAVCSLGDFIICYYLNVSALLLIDLILLAEWWH